MCPPYVSASTRPSVSSLRIVCLANKLHNPFIFRISAMACPSQERTEGTYNLPGNRRVCAALRSLKLVKGELLRAAGRNVNSTSPLSMPPPHRSPVMMEEAMAAALKSANILSETYNVTINTKLLNAAFALDQHAKRQCLGCLRDSHPAREMVHAWKRPPLSSAQRHGCLTCIPLRCANHDWVKPLFFPQLVE